MKKSIIRSVFALAVSFAVLLCPVTSFAEESNYYTLQEEIVLPDGGYNINTDYIGIKVIKTNLALLDSSSARYTATTEKAVRQFQMDNGLTVSGEVDLDTWLAMGYTEEDWYGLGTYTHPILTTKYSSREDIVNAMLIAAKEHADEGTIYRVGASGYAGTYVDCSGLIFQCLYAAGINPEKNIVDHALQIYEYTSRNLEADDRLGDYVELSELQPGDLIFYHNKGVVCHVGIYAENGKMYDSWPNIGVTYRNYTQGGKVLSVRRVLPHYDEELGEVPDNAVTGRNMPLGSNSTVVFNNAGETVAIRKGEIFAVVDENDFVLKLSVSDETVPENGRVVAASGTHASWLLESVKVGDYLTEQDCLLLAEEPAPVVPEEEVKDEPVENDTNTNLIPSGNEDNTAATERDKTSYILRIIKICIG